MRRSTVSAEFTSDIQTVWKIVTDNTDTAWRSDLERVEAKDGGSGFTEYTKEGFSTQFSVTRKEPYNRYEFDMENANFTGHWTGIFSQTVSGGTRIDFTEELRVRNPVMELLSRLFMNIRKIQLQYIADLRKKLGES